MRPPQPVVLEGRIVRLEPLRIDHAPGLHQAGRDREIWRYLVVSQPGTLAETASFIRAAIASAASGGEIPFAIIHRESGRVAGTTRYLDIQREHGGLEIGWTWLSPDYQRTGANTECKYLLLRHAFDDLGAVRVQLKTDGRNERSQRAIERLGAQREGVLRKQRRIWDGFVRDTVYYSILDSDWPGVRARLEGLMAGRM